MDQFLADVLQFKLDTSTKILAYYKNLFNGVATNSVSSATDLGKLNTALSDLQELVALVQALRGSLARVSRIEEQRL